MNHLTASKNIDTQKENKPGLLSRFSSTVFSQLHKTPLRKIVVCHLLTLLVMVSLLAGQSLQAADATPSDKLLPPNVYGYISFPNISVMKNSFEKSSGQELLTDKAFADFRVDIEKKIAELSVQVKKNLGVSLKDLADIPSGEVAIAFLQTSEGNPALLALLNFGESRKTVDKLIAKAVTSIKKNENVTPSEENVDGTKIQIYTKGEQDEDDESGKLKDQFAYFIKDSVLVIGSSPEVLKDVLARWDGKHEETFAQNEIYQHIMKQCQTEGRASYIKWYIEPLGLFRNAATAAGQMNQQLQMGMAMLPMFGVTKFKAVGGTADNGGEKFESMSRTMAYVDLPADGLLKLFVLPATPLAPPRWVKSDVVGYASVNWDIDGAFDAARTMVDNFQGPGTFDKQIDRIAELPNGPKIHLKKDFADALNGKFHSVSYAPTVKDANLKTLSNQMPQVLVAIGLKDANKMQAVLNKLVKMPNFPGETRQFKNVSIYEIPLPNLQGAGGNQPNAPKFAFCVAKGFLFLTSNVKELEAIIRGNNDQQALVDSEAYKRIATNFPEKTSIIAYQRQEEQLKMYWKLLKSEDLQKVIDESPFKGIHLKKLPPFEAIQKYLTENGGFVVPNENGFIMTSFVVKKKK
ncbi:hypothetical protein MNBD_PLANCTO02-493 [hydrothermal vent metagenome]|uniref:DUF3352 domain-containing protein n=1 Tax=hydrothermal vent metagenome TaxID=652676 RepID=A0A3B1DR40_9ZZZZ